MDKSKLAFVFSGGGSRGAYQCGAWQAMSELGIKPDIVAGVSVGAINGAMVMQEDVIKSAELWRTMETDMVFDVESHARMRDFAKEFIVNRGAGSTGLQSLLHKYIDEGHIRKSKTDYGLLTVEFPSMKPYYLWKEDIPEGMLPDYITASASAFPYIHTHKIGGKEFIDGAYEDNLPVSMALNKGATEIIAVSLEPVSRIRPDKTKVVPDLTLIRSHWDLGDFLVFDKENTKRILRIGYLDAMKVFNIFEGKFFAFAKGEFNKRDLDAADHTAKLFELDPLILYRRKTFTERLEKAVQDARKEAAETLDEIEESLLALRGIDKVVNKKTAVLTIAQDMKNKGSESIFASKYIDIFLDEDIAAIKFLLRYNLI